MFAVRGCERGTINMEEMKKKERLVNLIMAVIMSAVMGITFALIARKSSTPQALQSMPPLPVMLISSLVESIIVGIIVALVIPMGRMGRSLAEKFDATPPSLKFNLINSIPFAVINAVLVSAICSFISIAQSHSHMVKSGMPADIVPPLFIMWFGSWIKTLPLSIVVGYVIAIIIAPFVIKAVGLGGPPEGAPGRPPVEK